jgi:biopolymer transport protein ExbB/TolQ
MLTWIVLISWLTRLVLVLLLGLSIWSVAIMIDRYRLFNSLKKEDNLDEVKKLIKSGDRGRVQQWASGRGTIRAGLLNAALEVNASGGSDPVDRVVKSFVTEERNRLEKGLTVLATLGSNAPFIGLFGTVLGIIQAFAELGQEQKGANAVMSGISEALVATAVGLFVAIPAVVAYNVFAKQIKDFLTECEVIRDLFVSRFSAGEKG